MLRYTAPHTLPLVHEQFVNDALARLNFSPETVCSNTDPFPWSRMILLKTIGIEEEEEEEEEERESMLREEEVSNEIRGLFERWIPSNVTPDRIKLPLRMFRREEERIEVFPSDRNVMFVILSETF